MSQLYDWLFTQNTTIAASDSGPCCSALISALDSKVSLPGSSGYGLSLASYYSLDSSNATPLCIVSPETAEDVSVTIRTLTDTATGLSRGSPEAQEPFCQFAIRSGGHMTSASNINGGVTIDLRALNSITLNEDRSLASMGVGLRPDTRLLTIHVQNSVVECNVAIMVASMPAVARFVRSGVQRLRPHRDPSRPSSYMLRDIETFGSPRHRKPQYHELTDPTLLASQPNFSQNTQIKHGNSEYEDSGIYTTTEITQKSDHAAGFTRVPL
ncbi:hypothetical protein PG996_004996 [Apiospora saccharicola]|uniref:Uncharacterized protein n=1 Tax=Apiospora saccharicola TaxID=335842 RepID=A0ABR1VKB2_9PEZI